jgi:putative phage-type endonuclease
MELSDGEYVPENNNDSSSYDSDSTSIYTTCTTTVKNIPCLLRDLSENDICDIIIDIYDQMADFLKKNVLSLSSATFYRDMFNTIALVLYDEWVDADLYGEDSDEEVENIGELVDFVEQVWDVYADFCEIPLRSIAYENMRSERVSFDVADITNKIRHLEGLEQPAQRTPEWYEFRNNLLSASSLSKVFGSEAQVNSLIYEKCSPVDRNAPNFSKTNINSPTHWGVKYEPVTVMIYEDLFHTKVGEFGCIRHPQYHFIGASPDGINVDPTSSRYGRMLEIKNIYNRDITGIPKEEYWVQTQIQMETCDLDYCDFMETRIKEYEAADDFYTDNSREYKGVVLHFIETDSRSPTVNHPHYQYMPFEGFPEHRVGNDIGKEKSEIDAWIKKVREESKLKGLVLFNVLYWYLDEYSCVLIPRNRVWFQSALPKIGEVWQTIVKEREEGYEHRATKKKLLKNVIVTSDSASNSYHIENLNTNRSICLVKLG